MQKNFERMSETKPEVPMTPSRSCKQLLPCGIDAAQDAHQRLLPGRGVARESGSTIVILQQLLQPTLHREGSLNQISKCIDDFVVGFRGLIFVGHGTSIGALALTQYGALL